MFPGFNGLRVLYQQLHLNLATREGLCRFAQPKPTSCTSPKAQYGTGTQWQFWMSVVLFPKTLLDGQCQALCNMMCQSSPESSWIITR